MNYPVSDCDHHSAAASPATRTHGNKDSYGPPPGDPRLLGGPPGTTPTSGTHAPWATGGVLQVRNVRALVDRLSDSGPHPTTAHHTNAADTGRAVAAGIAHATGPHSPGFGGLSPPPPYGGVHTGGGPDALHGAHDGATV